MYLCQNFCQPAFLLKILMRKTSFYIPAPRYKYRYTGNDRRNYIEKRPSRSTRIKRHKGIKSYRQYDKYR